MINSGDNEHNNGTIETVAQGDDRYRLDPKEHKGIPDEIRPGQNGALDTRVGGWEQFWLKWKTGCEDYFTQTEMIQLKQKLQYDADPNHDTRKFQKLLRKLRE